MKLISLLLQSAIYMSEHMTVEASVTWTLSFVVVWRLADPTPSSVPPGFGFMVFR